VGYFVQRLLYTLELSFAIVAINLQGKVDVGSDVHDRMWYRLPMEALLRYSKANGEHAQAIDVVRDAPTWIWLIRHRM
jgi:hypothetical protein